MNKFENIMITETITSAKEDNLNIYKILVEELTQYANKSFNRVKNGITRSGKIKYSHCNSC